VSGEKRVVRATQSPSARRDLTRLLAGVPRHWRAQPGPAWPAAVCCPWSRRCSPGVVAW